MKAIVIYKSKTGFAKKYAEWIAEELSADIFDVSKVNIKMLEPYDVVIYGGSLYAVGINGIQWITKNLDKLENKKVIVFATGASPARQEVIEEIKNKNFTSDQQKKIQFFYFRGGFDYSKLKPFDKMLMTILKWRLKTKKELTPDENGMLAIYNKPTDFTCKKNIEEMIRYIDL
ncbi:flavodoxin domain-containing protein [Clostridium magnum]|uniref:Flavodoxin n=1 Tax=Clostridium magnum DSM 2767 TaxID=1121326 RepID=A0A161XD55_9CLOT|nr:flavodoxin domain-containing protein [Clostridium magnum]KZL92266.1 flavodoxin [Clostridium magnum DSM 2767]SHH15652.1 Protoporphyrinogen IX oxidase, menaquinone-dependent (flavodoxin domain) [Clostridium magnum DSM 2767]